MPFLFFILILLLFPLIIITFFLLKLRRAFYGKPNPGNVKYQRHYGEQPINEAVEEEILEYSEEDVIEAEFEEIDDDKNQAG